MSKPRYRLTCVGKVRNGTPIWMARPKIFVRGVVLSKPPFSRIVTVGIGHGPCHSKKIKMHETKVVWIKVG